MAKAVFAIDGDSPNKKKDRGQKGVIPPEFKKMFPKQELLKKYRKTFDVLNAMWGSQEASNFLNRQVFGATGGKSFSAFAELDWLLTRHNKDFKKFAKQPSAPVWGSTGAGRIL